MLFPVAAPSPCAADPLEPSRQTVARIYNMWIILASTLFGCVRSGPMARSRASSCVLCNIIVGLFDVAVSNQSFLHFDVDFAIVVTADGAVDNRGGRRIFRWAASHGVPDRAGMIAVVVVSVPCCPQPCQPNYE